MGFRQRITRNHAAFASGFVALLSASVALASPANVRLISAASGEVRLEVTAPAPKVAPAGGDVSAGAVRVDWPDWETWGPPGEAALPVCVVNVAVPADGNVSVSARGLEPTSLAPVWLVPLSAAGEEAAANQVYVKPRAPSAARAAGPRARVAGISWLRNQRVAEIEVTPAEYDAASGRLTTYAKVEVAVSIPPSAGAPAVLALTSVAPDPFEQVYKDVVVNYEQGKSWRRGLSTAGPAGALAVPDTSVFPGRQWLRIRIDRTALYRLDGARISAAFSGFPLGTLPVDSLRLFVWPGNPVLPESNTCDTCGYREVAIGIQDAQTGPQTGTHGLFDSADYFYFWANGPSDWLDMFPEATGDSSYLNNPYENHNYYWLTWGTPAAPVGGPPKRIALADATLRGTGFTPTTFPARLHLERDTEYIPAAYNPSYRWEKWFWQSFSAGQTYSFLADAPGADTTQNVHMTALLWGASTGTHRLDVSFNGQAFPRRSWYDPEVSLSYFVPQYFDTTGPFLRSTGNVLNTGIPASPGGARSALAWWELRYARRFQPVSDTLLFDSPGTATDYDYVVTGFRNPQPPHAFDITDPLAPVELTGMSWTQVGADTFQLGFSATEATPHRYWIGPFGYGRAVDPSALRSYGVEPNWRSALNGADYVILYFDGDGNSAASFAQAAGLLAAHRRSKLYVAGSPSATHEVVLVPISDVYNQFSGGRIDPGAVRNFFHAAVKGNWRKAPGYGLLLGDGSYDYKNINGAAAPGQPTLFIPTYENGYIVGQWLPYETDDWLFDADPDPSVLPDLAGGRIPASDPATALRVIRDKIIPYDANPDLSDWKNRVCLVGDDFYQAQGGPPDCIPHITDTVDLEQNFLPLNFDRSLVYLYKYPYGPSGGTKPLASSDLKKVIEGGALMVNYIGHGSPFKWADESVLLSADAETFTNQRQLNLLVAASCDVSKFSDPAIPCLGERMLLHGEGGSVAVVAATEIGFSFANTTLNKRLYSYLFRRPGDEPGFPIPLGVALQSAKRFVISENSRRYPLLGDPGTVLAAPRLWADVQIFDATGSPLTQMARGQTVEARGAVFDNPGYPDVRPFDGSATLLIEDAAPADTAVYPAGCPFSPVDYYAQRAPVYRGDVSVKNGQFKATFVVPGDAKLGPYGRVRAYLHGSVGGATPDSDGVGSLDVPIVTGTLPSGDDAGPSITLSFPGGATDVRPGTQLRADIGDPSGVLITGHNPANSIFVTLDGNTNNRTDITSTFRYASNSYQQGTAFFVLPNDIALGAHEIAVNAADNLAVGVQAARHRSKASLQFTVSDNPSLRINRTFAFPNPTPAGTPLRIVVDVQGGPVNCLIRIYTVSGRLVRTLKVFGGLGQMQIPWDGLDDQGQSLANGVYLYRVQINGQEADGTSSPTQISSTDGRIVFVNR